MNFDDFQDLFENLSSSGISLGDMSFDQLTDMMVDAGINISDLTDDQISQLMEATGRAPSSGDGVRFGSWEQSEYSKVWYEKDPDGNFTGDWSR